MPDSDIQPVVVLVKDLMFSSKISSTARALGVEVRMLRDPTKLAAEPGRRLIVDLNQDGAIPAAAAWKAATAGQVIGFVSHVDAEKIAEARAAGVDSIMPRSQFVHQLEELLRPAP